MALGVLLFLIGLVLFLIVVVSVWWAFKHDQGPLDWLAKKLG